jgi:ribonuclease E
MRMLMPSQAKKVQAYRDPTPLFVKHRVEDHLSQIYSPNVALKSGGYLVINQTEALVAIDVNSGRSTREKNIEATALKTNMEAAEEAARQLRLRDLAGLIVIDFIDMDESKNNRAVEKKLKDALKDDRARIQMGKISSFGLMEISRQRRRSGVLEGTTHVCEHCAGTGRVRSVESSALSALRAVEMEAVKGGGEAVLKVPVAVGLYILNEKRNHLARVHESRGLFITIALDDNVGLAGHEIERTASEPRPEHAITHHRPIEAYVPTDEDIADDDVDDIDDEIIEDDDEDGEDEDRVPSRGRPREVEADSEDGEDRNARRDRRRRRRGRRDEPKSDEARPPVAAEARSDEEDDGQGGRRRRRGRRGGRRTREDGRPMDAFSWVRPWVPYGEDAFVWHDPAEDMKPAAPAAERPERPERKERQRPERVAEPVATSSEDDIWVELPAVEEKPKRTRTRRGRGPAEAPAFEVEVAEVEAVEPASEAVVVESAPAIERVIEAEPAVEAPPAKPARARRTKAAKAEVAAEPVAVEAEPVTIPEPEAVKEKPKPREPDPAEISAPPASPRKGWWRR